MQCKTADFHARNEVIVQGTNAFLLGRQVALVSIGATALGLARIQELLEQAAACGEVMENDLQERGALFRRQMGERISESVSSWLAGVLNVVPGVGLSYRAPGAAETVDQDGNSAADDDETRSK